MEETLDWSPGYMGRGFYLTPSTHPDAITLKHQNLCLLVEWEEWIIHFQMNSVFILMNISLHSEGHYFMKVYNQIT